MTRDLETGRFAAPDPHVYVTATPAPLNLQLNETDGVYFVTLSGDRVKVLYEGASETAAARAFEAVKAMYEERRVNEHGG